MVSAHSWVQIREGRVGVPCGGEKRQIKAFQIYKVLSMMEYLTIVTTSIILNFKILAQYFE